MPIPPSKKRRVASHLLTEREGKALKTVEILKRFKDEVMFSPGERRIMDDDAADRFARRWETKVKLIQRGRPRGSNRMAEIDEES
jgi:hypothetical protein